MGCMKTNNETLGLRFRLSDLFHSSSRVSSGVYNKQMHGETTTLIELLSGAENAQDLEQLS
jgi:hypothetical protein